jgi:hypothetical protein
MENPYGPLNSDISQPSGEITEPKPHTWPFLGVGAFLIFYSSTYASSFSHECRSDGCIGIAFTEVFALGMLLIQLFVVIPICTYKTKKAGHPILPTLIFWIAVSMGLYIAALPGRNPSPGATGSLHHRPESRDGILVTAARLFAA